MTTTVNKQPSPAESTDSILSLQARLRDWGYLGRLITKRDGATANDAIRAYEKQEDAIRRLGLRVKK